MLQLEFDRAELTKLATQAQEHFQGVREDRRRWSYIYSPDADFLGLVPSSLPSFWKPSLSRIFATGEVETTTKHPGKMTRDERIAKAQELSRSGQSYEQIARTLNVTKGTAYNYVKGYPYRA